MQNYDPQQDVIPAAPHLKNSHNFFRICKVF